MTVRTSLALAAAALIAIPSAAAAATYTFNSTIPLGPTGTVVGHGTITAADTVSTGYDGYYTGFLVSAISGTYDGANIVGLVPVNTLGSNDNLINTSQDLVDYDGLGFLVDAVLPGYVPAIGYQTTVVNFYDDNQNGFADSGAGNYGTFTLTTVPEPATWVMMLVGLGGVGSAVRGRRARVVGALPVT